MEDTTGRNWELHFANMENIHRVRSAYIALGDVCSRFSADVVAMEELDELIEEEEEQNKRKLGGTGIVAAEEYKSIQQCKDGEESAGDNVNNTANQINKKDFECGLKLARDDAPPRWSVPGGRR